MVGQSDHEKLFGRRVTRRQVLRGAVLGGAALAAATVVGCGGGEEEKPTAAKSKVKYRDPGISDTEVKIGFTTGLTGAAAVQLVVIAGAYQAYIKYVNQEKGGVKGRKIDLVVLDDGLVPDRIAANVRKLVDQDKVFAIAGATPVVFGQEAVREFINKDKKVPYLLSGDGLLRWEPPDKNPYFQNGVISYSREGWVQGKHILENFPDARVGILRENDDLGKDYEVGLREAFGDKADKIIVKVQTYDLGATNLDAQVIALKDANVDVWFQMALAHLNIGGLNKAFQIGFRPKQIYVTPHAHGINQLVEVPPDIAKGIIGLFTFKNPVDPKYGNDPGVQLYLNNVKKYAAESVKDPADPVAHLGYSWGVLLVKFLNDMFEKYEPTRDGLMNAARNFGPYDLDGFALPGVVYQGSKENQNIVTKAVRGRFNGKFYDILEPVASLYPS